MNSLKVNKKVAGNFIIIELAGYLDFESSNQLGEQFQFLFRNDNAKVVFDFSKLEFVGSSGVSNFVRMLCSFNKRTFRPLYCGVKAEFHTLFNVFGQAFPFDVRENITPEILIQHLNEVPSMRPIA